jgi:hypothetical protein
MKCKSFASILRSSRAPTRSQKAIAHAASRSRHASRNFDELRIASCFKFVDDLPREPLHASAPVEGTLRVLDRNDVPGIVIGDGVRIAARKVIEIECSRVRFNAGIERNIEPPQLADDGSPECVRAWSPVTAIAAAFSDFCAAC